MGALVYAKLGLQLLTESGAIEEVRGSVVDVYWQEGEEPEPAELLYFGKQSVLEKKRSRLAEKAAHRSCDSTAVVRQQRTCTSCAEKENTIQELQKEIAGLKHTPERN
ncbi:uncharacterized protein LOC135372833 [Ornithodoros turicata]|uniref:uncharacterized protein LOC135372833 n=1 Tax=Ornithodoros turicata TaxID=34597 RepID=UPI003139C5E1